MELELMELRHKLSLIQVDEDALHSRELRTITERIARLMLNENLDWRIVFQDRPLVFPT
jgi:hypothetical protein